MNLFKNPYIAGIIITLSVIIFYLASTGRVLGKFVNQFFPCEQNPANSFPCYGQYDIAVMAIAVIIGVIFLGALAFNVYKLLRPKGQ